MTSIHIRNVPPATLAALRRLAKLHRRSLQGELLTILERAASFAPPEGGGLLDLNFVDTGKSKAMSRNEVYEDDR